MISESSPVRDLLAIHAAVLLFGFAGLFAKWLPLSPLVIVFGRVVFAGMALAAGIAAFVPSAKWRIVPASDALVLLALGVLLSVHWAAFFEAVQVSSVAVGLLSYSSFPVFTAFLEPLALKEKVDRSSIFFGIVCLTGVFMIVPRFDLTHQTFRGVLWGLLSGLTFSILAVQNRRLAQRHSSLVVAFYEDAFAAVALLPFVLRGFPRLEAGGIGLLLLLGVVCTAVAHTLFIRGMRRIGARTASLISSLEPVYGIALALVFLGEIPAPRTILGGLIIVAAAAAVTAASGQGRATQGTD